MYAVAGVSGKTGAAAAQRLLDRGEAVRVIVRDPDKGEIWAKRGAEVAVASLDDSEALRRALDGVRGAYLLVVPGPRAEDFSAASHRMTDAIAAALRSVGARAVLLSSVGAQHPEGTGPIKGLHAMERKLASRPNVTFLRPAYFMENWAGVLPLARAQGVLPSIFPLGVAAEMVSTRDIGRVAADLLLEVEAPRVVELSGPRAYTVEESAVAIGEALGRDLMPSTIPTSQVAGAMEAAGIGASLAAEYGEMAEGAGRGLLAFEGDRIRRGYDALTEAVARLVASAPAL